MARDKLKDQQRRIRIHYNQEAPLFQVGDKVWLCSKSTSKNQSLKLFPKFMGLFNIVDDNHTYLVEQNGHVSQESENWLNAYFSSGSDVDKAPRSDEPNC